MFWHKWSGGTIYDNISGPAGPIMSNIIGPPGPLMAGPFIYVVTDLTINAGFAPLMIYAINQFPHLGAEIGDQIPTF